MVRMRRRIAIPVTAVVPVGSPARRAAPGADHLRRLGGQQHHDERRPVVRTTAEQRDCPGLSLVSDSVHDRCPSKL